MDVFLTNTLICTSLKDWSGVDCEVCISCLDSQSHGTHSLQRIRCWASDVLAVALVTLSQYVSPVLNLNVSVHVNPSNDIWLNYCMICMSLPHGPASGDVRPSVLQKLILLWEIISQKAACIPVRRWRKTWPSWRMLSSSHWFHYARACEIRAHSWFPNVLFITAFSILGSLSWTVESGLGQYYQGSVTLSWDFITAP